VKEISYGYKCMLCVSTPRSHPEGLPYRKIRARAHAARSLNTVSAPVATPQGTQASSG
ncbi:hypothetical protein HAX54_038648, partial [Datura stramonium]|nr:hypothetical protein [Datura stramonium]